MKVVRLSALLIILDQATKLVIKGFSIPWLGVHVAGMPLGESHDILGNFLRLTYIENPGMAFGVNFGDATKIFFSPFSLIASGAILGYLYSLRKGPAVIRIALALILAGAFGNFIDRTFYGVFYGTAPLFHGSVVDFIDVDFFAVTIGRFHLDRWPVFNIADSCVTVGVILFILKAQRPRSTSSLPVAPEPSDAHIAASPDASDARAPSSGTDLPSAHVPNNAL